MARGLVFRRSFALEDAIGSHACSREANMRMTNDIPLGCPCSIGAIINPLLLSVLS
jgi:hypothetical protein